MSYEKNTRETGDTITAEKLNHMENGIASSLELHVVYDDEAMETRYSGEEIQSIATNLPDRLAVGFSTSTRGLPICPCRSCSASS